MSATTGLARRGSLEWLERDGMADDMLRDPAVELFFWKADEFLNEGLLVEAVLCLHLAESAWDDNRYGVAS